MKTSTKAKATATVKGYIIRKDGTKEHFTATSEKKDQKKDKK